MMNGKAKKMGEYLDESKSSLVIILSFDAFRQTGQENLPRTIDYLETDK